ncbi:MAG: hypothetical protein O3A00_16760 [Planctomycetota bacterium]|nr:hypothetical protein [Planctomycetota bacterium]
MSAIPFLTNYDPPGTSEGTLDPLGLYQIADQLATRLVPAVRERMQRVRFLTAMAVGSLVTEGLEGDPEQPDESPFLVWEWLVVEAIIRSMGNDPELRRVPGTLVTRRAIAEHGYLDGRSYLKTPRIFGFHGVYKRLAIHLGLVNVHLDPRPECERLADAWARDMGYAGLDNCRPLLNKWRRAVKQSLSKSPARTRTGWSMDDWSELADAVSPFDPSNQVRKRREEKQFLKKLLHAADDRSLHALPTIWRLQKGFGEEDFAEEPLHNRLQKERPEYAPLLEAIRTYEQVCRGLEDAFDILRAEAALPDARGFEITSIGRDDDFAQSVHALDRRYEETRQRLGEVDLQMPNVFDARFSRFAQPMTSTECAMAICEHHETIQKAKGDKRKWFDWLDGHRIYMRHQYRVARRPIKPDQYVHDYRGRPIRNFYFDLK